MVERYTQNEYVLGEGWVVGVPRSILNPPPIDDSDASIRISPFTWQDDGAEEEDPSLEDMEFRLLSVREISFLDGGVVRLDWDSPASENGQLELRERDIYSFRIWRPHPMRYLEANSPTRAILPTLRELVGLTMHISAQIDSRLAGERLFVLRRHERIVRRAGRRGPGVRGCADRRDDHTDQGPILGRQRDPLVVPSPTTGRASNYSPADLPPHSTKTPSSATRRSVARR